MSTAGLMRRTLRRNKMDERSETEILEEERAKAGETSENPDVKYKPKKTEFSKVIAVIAIVIWITVIIFSMVMIAVTLDTSGLMPLFESVSAVVGIVYTTYSLKAKAENMIKLKRIYGYDAESVVDKLLQHYEYDSE